MTHIFNNILLMTPMKKWLPVMIVFLCSCGGINLAHGKIQVSLAEPNWQFLLDNRLLEASEAKLDAGERNFAQTLKPLLSAKNYEAAAEAFSSRDIEGDSAALRQLRGQVYLSLKRYDQAEQALLSAITLMPNLAISHRSLSMLYMLQKDHVKASKHLTRSIQLGIADAQHYGQLAFINLNNHNAASAIVGYQQALYLEPKNIQWQQGLLYAWLNSHNYSAAQQLVDDMLEQGLHSNPLELWLLRSQIALQNHKPKRALASLEIALYLYTDVNSTDARSNDTLSLNQHIQNKVLAAKLHLRHGSIQRSIDLLTSSLQDVSGFSVEQDHSVKKEVLTALDQILPWLFGKDEGQKASELLNVAESINIPGIQQAKFNMYRGQLEIVREQHEQALKYLRRSIAQDPSLGEALLSLAKVYQQQSNIAQAQRYFVRASAIPKFKVRALLANAQLQIEQKQYSQALDLLLQAIKIEPHRQDIRNNVQALQKIVEQARYAS